MQIKTTFSIATDAVDEYGNKISPSKDIILMQSLEGELDKTPDNQKDIDLLNSFEAEIQEYKGCVAINENYEASYIPPYDDVAGTIRHKLSGKRFIVLDLDKVDTRAFMTAERVNADDVNK